MSSSNCCFLSCIQISQEAGQVVWYSHLFQNCPQLIVIHTVKGFGLVNKAEIDVFLELSCFFHDPADVGNLISGSSAFSKTSLRVWIKWNLKGFPGCTGGKNPPASPGEMRGLGLIHGSGRSLRVGNDNSSQYSYLENSVDREAWWAIVHGATESWTGLRKVTNSKHHSLFLTL